MKERIKELYNQAFVPHTTICPDNNMPYETVLFSTEKFAELIVKECAAICDDAIKDNDKAYKLLLDLHEMSANRGAKNQAEKLSNSIKEHFGVEE